MQFTRAGKPLACDCERLPALRHCSRIQRSVLPLAVPRGREQRAGCLVCHWACFWTGRRTATRYLLLVIRPVTCCLPPFPWFRDFSVLFGVSFTHALFTAETRATALLPLPEPYSMVPLRYRRTVLACGCFCALPALLPFISITVQKNTFLERTRCDTCVLHGVLLPAVPLWYRCAVPEPPTLRRYCRCVFVPGGPVTTIRR